MRKNVKNTKFLLPYFGLTYLVLLVNTSSFLTQVNYAGFIAYAFCFATLLSYCFVYLLPLFLILALLQHIITTSSAAYVFRSIRIRPMWIIYALAVAITTFLQLLMFTDAFIFRMYGFHLNGFVWNLIVTQGGIQSMGADTRTTVFFLLIALGFLILQITLLILLVRVRRFEKFAHAAFRKKITTPAIALVVLLFLFQALTYGFSSIYGFVPVLSAARVFPLFQPVTFAKLAAHFGIESKRNPQGLRPMSGSFGLQYPLNPIKYDPNRNKYNIVWLVAESLRADMLDSNIMPQTWTFSEKALRFEQHYSAGNGTRMAMFGMFYGLYGTYWFSFLNQNRGPVLMDVLLADDYQVDVFTSARFSYPEFDRTIFARLSQEEMHDETEDAPGLGWQRDRENVGRMIDFIRHTDPNRPFMTFLFFESPHARYYFPPENAIAKPYLEEFNYATANIERDIKLIFNRYINSCNHLDSQLNRIIRYLEQADLLKSTIVLITGDHGEEFMEKGHWGHNSGFTEEQVRTPLVLWIPGVEPRQIHSITSHLDIPATILSALGISSPPNDYSLGFDLTTDVARDFTILSSWDKLGYVDSEYKAIFPMKTHDFILNKVTTSNDMDVNDTSAFYETRQKRLVQIMTELTRFRQ